MRRPFAPRTPDDDACASRPWIAVGSRAADASVGASFAAPGTRTVAEDAYDALALLAATHAAGCLVAAEAVAERPLAALIALRDQLPAGSLGVLLHPDHPAVGEAARRLGLPVIGPESSASRFVTPPPDREPPRVPDWPPPPRDLAARCLEMLAAGDDVAKWLVETLAEATGARRLSVLLLGARGTHLDVVAVHGAPESLLGPGRIEVDASLAGRVLLAGKPHVGRMQGARERGYRGTRYVLLPLFSAVGPVGVVCFTDLPGDRVPDLQRVAAWSDALRPAARALAVAQRLARAEAASVRDPLTGLANRRAFERAFRREFERARRANRGLGLVMVDVDHFKSINDELGHDIGDVVLKQIAARLGGVLRETDLVARWGGEEFALLLPDATAGSDVGPLGAAERLRESIAAEPFELGHDLASRVVTVSVGLATLTPDDTAAELLRRADQALLKAKAGGRNRVERA